MSAELLRLIDAIHREKGVDREVLFEALESALTTAVRKRLGAGDDIEVRIDRQTGRIESENEEYEVTPEFLGRIAAQTAKQVFHQKVREAEQSTIYDSYSDLRGEIVTGRVSKFEGDAIIVTLNQRVEGIIPRDHRIRGENYKPGDSIRCLIWDVKKVGQRVRIILSRTNPDLVARLFEIEVPEIADGIIDIKRVVREPGYRTKIAVASSDPKVDCVGACVGIRGSRIKSITDELNGEKIDIIRWSDSLEMLVMNALKPAQIDLDDIYPDIDNHRVIVIVDEDQQSLAIGKRGQNVRLASQLCGWDIDIKTRAEVEREAAELSGEGRIEAEEEAEEETSEGEESGEEELIAEELASGDLTERDSSAGLAGLEGEAVAADESTVATSEEPAERKEAGNGDVEISGGEPSVGELGEEADAQGASTPSEESDGEEAVVDARGEDELHRAGRNSEDRG